MEESRHHELELIDQAIHKILADNRNKEAAFKDDNEQLLLSKLLSELESLKGDDTPKEPEAASAEDEEANHSAAMVVDSAKGKALRVHGGNSEIAKEDIVKELRKVKKQNAVTHCLLSIMIVLTVVWQLSEVSLILKLKEGLSHPFKSFGSMLFRTLAGPPGPKEQNGEKQNSVTKDQQIETHLKLPELPNLDLGLDLHGESDSED